MPETGALIGTPASISASVEPQTEPIDDEPFDSSVSETIRIVYGKSSDGREDRLERPLRQRAVADVTPLRASHEARLPDRVGREVVVVHEAAVGLERQVVDPLAFLRGAERQQASGPASARAGRAPSRARAGLTVTSHSIGRISSAPRPSGRRLSIAIFLRTRSL